jgi:hypothetical protein
MFSWNGNLDTPHRMAICFEALLHLLGHLPDVSPVVLVVCDLDAEQVKDRLFPELDESG